MTEQVAAPQAPDDLYAHVTTLDPDELLKRHPQLAERVGAQADRQAAARLEAETQQAAARHKEALYQRSQAGDAQAELELLDLTKRELGSAHSRRAAQEAEEALRQKLWQRDAAAYDLDASDPAVLAAVKDAKSLREVGATLERLQAERQAARAAKATAQPATSTAASDPAAQIAALARRGEKPSPELWDAYRSSTGRVRPQPAAPRGRR